MLYCIDAPKPGDANGVIWFWETNTKGKEENTMKTTVAIVGLGSRGRVTYAPIAKQYPDLMEITALADINPACVVQRTEGALLYECGRAFGTAEAGRCDFYLHSGSGSCPGSADGAGKRLPYPDGEADFPQCRGLQ